MLQKIVRFLVAHPARTRSLVLALLVLAASFVPGIPVDLIDAVVVAVLALVGGEAVVKRRNTTQDHTEAF